MPSRYFVGPAVEDALGDDVGEELADAELLADEVGLADDDVFGDVVGFAVVLAGVGLAVGLGAVDVCSTRLGREVGVVRCSVGWEGAGADELSCVGVVLGPAPLAWPAR